MGRRRRRRGYRTKNKNPTRQCVEKTYIYIYMDLFIIELNLTRT